MSKSILGSTISTQVYDKQDSQEDVF